MNPGPPPTSQVDSPPAPRRAASQRLLLLLGLAVLFTLLNAVKPLVIDDVSYYYYAAQMAQHPGDPYGFLIPDLLAPRPANATLAPPLLPYWWSLGIRLFGDRPFLWKLWLLPFSLLFVSSLYALFRRFARGLEMPLTTMTVLSPTFLPSLNLMLDVPALALGLSALALFWRACDRRSVLLTVVAGLVAGLAMQTKYTAFLVPVAMLLWGLFRRRISYGLLAASLAVGVFVAWERFMAAHYGASHFLYHLRQQPKSLDSKLDLFFPLLSILGGVASVTVLLGLTALRVPRWVVGIAAAVVVLAYALVAFVPYQSAPDGLQEFTVSEIGLTEFIYRCLGGLVCGSALSAAWRLTRPSIGRGSEGQRVLVLHGDRQTWFLVFWLGLEVAGYFALTPFPATRRVMGVVVVATVLMGRLAARTCRSPSRRRFVWGVAVAGIVVGLGFYGVDLREAVVEKDAAENAAHWIRERDPDARIWYVGSWGFQYYAEYAGMSRVVFPYRTTGGPFSWPPPTRFREGDWLVQPDWHIYQPPIVGPERALEQVELLDTTDALPLRTVSCYYGGNTPLRHHEGPRCLIVIYRVSKNFVPSATPRR